ncbi:MAG: hypothetical protein ACXADA_05415 [Candidatus Hodarchaeales archaeon]|jgi:hypothetical protein
MKLKKPSKVILVGSTRGVEELFRYFNRNTLENYPEHPLDGSLSQVAGLVDGIPVLAFSDDDSALQGLETLVQTTFEGEKLSIGIIATLNYHKEIEKHFKWLKTIDLKTISRFVFFIDIEDNPGTPLPEGYGNDDFIPIDMVIESYRQEMEKLIHYYEDLPDSLKIYCLRAFDLVYFPISTSAGIGLEPSSQALIMETDN